MKTRKRSWKILISLVTVIAMLSAMTVMVSANAIDPQDPGPMSVEISKSVSSTSVHLGEMITYTITVINNSNAGWANAKIAADSDFSDVIKDQYGQTLATIGYSDVVWSVDMRDIGVAPNGGTATGTYTVSITDGPYEAWDLLENNVSIKFTAQVKEGTMAHTNTVSDKTDKVLVLPVTVLDPVISLEKSVLASSSLVIGGVANYEIVITNSNSYPVIITEIIDDNYDISGYKDVILAPAEELKIYYSISPLVEGILPNTASVTVKANIPVELNPASDADTETITVSAAPPPPVVSTGSSSTKYTTPPVEITVAGAEMPEPEPEVAVMGAEMPKTGDNSNNLFAILGLIVLTAAGILIFTMAKRQKSS
jgi:LPXTG-motif cell wall-anchored protein